MMNAQNCVSAANIAAQTDAMVDMRPQRLTEIIQPAQALALGSLYPELHKPMETVIAPITTHATAQQQYAFAAWELRLYLNTHPNDHQALFLFRQMNAHAGQPNYAGAFIADSSTRWTWLDDPWPWEYAANQNGTALTAAMEGNNHVCV